MVWNGGTPCRMKIGIFGDMEKTYCKKGNLPV